MKFLHLADLHIGKRLNEFSLIEDQKYILSQIIDIIDEELPFGVIIAGDIYDKLVPSAEAIEVLDEFLCNILKREVKIFMISGNHDSPERLGFGANILSKNGLYISKTYNGKVEKINFGDVNIYMLPFIKPANVKRFYPQEIIESYTDAVKIALKDIEKSGKNILITHQFVTGSEISDSEELSVGGSDNVDIRAFDGFDYVALGHLHKPQNVKTSAIRYSGTPLKYSFSEANHRKSVTVVNLADEVKISEIPLEPLRDLREIKGKFDEINETSEDYLHVILTDEQEIINVMSKLRVNFPNLMKISYDNTRTRAKNDIKSTSYVKIKSPYELFSELFEQQNGQQLTENQDRYLKNIIEKVWEDKKCDH